ncbi:trehalose-phosphate synthase [Catellatospora methionotrophica]|uniref:Trehalose-phosphate synthase n=1 Tax=Catellatospora methionotrophica TaxID=121620 RepID=A0A8J3LN99_9ACTN|nr:trehalose-6-phosphate synthase [Catellatospora methionotrophica]GIG18684.1 trehalose-phosphate synthase [Catellatospora methionotrophica]
MTARYDLIVAGDRVPAPDPDDSNDHVDVALASLRPFVAAHGGAWAAVPDGAHPPDADVLHVDIDGQDARLGAGLLRALYHHQSAEFPPGWFTPYEQANTAIADAVAGSAALGGTVWVHGHQLQLLPRLLRKRRPDLATAVHLHSAFPPAESFARLPEHRELLAGLLGADVVALPHRRAVDNLLDLAGRVHGLPVRDNQIAVGNHRVRVLACALPADTGGMRRLARLPRVRERAAEIRAALRVGGPVLLSIAGWDPSDAVEQRLLAFERFLAERRPEPCTVALLHVAYGDPRTPDELDQRERVDRLIAKINGTHANVGQAVVHYVRDNPDRRELAALYLACDGLLATPVHHGTVNPAHEFVAARGEQGATVVLSELTSNAAEVPGAIVVNPHDTAAYADAIAQAVGLYGPVPQAGPGSAELGLDSWAQHVIAVVRARAATVPVPPVVRPRRVPTTPGHTRPAVPDHLVPTPGGTTGRTASRPARP